MRFDEGESRYSRFARRSRPQQKRLVIYVVLLVAVIVGMIALQRQTGTNAAATIEWLSSPEKAKARALVEDKPILAFFTVEGNNDCLQMERVTFADNRVVAAAAKFVCLRLGPGEHAQLSESGLLDKLDCPAVAFVSADGRPLVIAWGARRPGEMLSEMKRAVAAWRHGRLSESPSLPPKSAGPSRGEAGQPGPAEPESAGGS